MYFCFSFLEQFHKIFQKESRKENYTQSFLGLETPSIWRYALRNNTIRSTSWRSSWSGHEHTLFHQWITKNLYGHFSHWRHCRIFPKFFPRSRTSQWLDLKIIRSPWNRAGVVALGWKNQNQWNHTIVLVHN